MRFRLGGPLVGSKVGRGQRAQRSESDGGTDDVPKGQKLKPNWDILLGGGAGHSRERSKVLPGGGRGAPLPQIMKIIANTDKPLTTVSCPVLNALHVEF